MTTTSTFKGMSEDAKPSSRVLRPPGGGSSNIFGGPDPTPATQPKTGGASKPADAGIFNAPADNGSKSGAQRSARDGDDSFNRLFGDTASSPVSGQKGTSASQRVNTHANLFGDPPESPKPSNPSGSANTHEKLFGDAATQGEGASGRYSGRGRGSYNPITGSDYKDLAPNHHALHVKEPPKPQKEQPPLPCSDGEYQTKEGKMQNVHTSSRITNPPGGKTHKLW